MKISWSHGANVVCLGKVFNDGWGAIVWLKNWKKPWIWKMTKRSGRQLNDCQKVLAQI